MADYHCEIIETITGRTIGIFVGSLNAISNRLLDNGFAPVDPLGNMTGEWAKCSKFEPELYARFIEIKKMAVSLSQFKFTALFIIFLVAVACLI